MNQNLYLQFADNFERQPDKVLIDTPNDERFRYRDVLAISRRMANVLRDTGVAPGDRVVVQVDKSPQVIMLYLACLQVGAVYLPLNTAYTGAEVDYFLGDAEPTLYVCRPADETAARELAGQRRVAALETLGAEGEGSLMQRVADAAEDDSVAVLQADDLAAILYTSGTTGRSKGAMLTHANLAANSQALARSWRFSADDHLLHALPIFHTHGLFVACNIVLTVGASMTFLPRLDPELLIDLMPMATVLMGVPTFYTRLLASPRLDRSAVANMRLFVSGSAPLLAETHQEFHARTGHAILERYGMTETNMNTSNPYDGERRPGTVGFALPGSEVRITERESGEILPPGETGAVEVRGPNVFKGYWRMPEKTAAEFREDGFFITGDLGVIDDDGYLSIVGRDKDLVISGGYNVYPKEIEQWIDELPQVLESAVIGVAHPDLGEGVTACVVLKSGQVLEESQVLSTLADKVARYKQPKRVFFIDSLPRNVMGKVQKNELRSRYAGTYQNADHRRTEAVGK
ncbi:malonate--CoA ligase [Salinicola rhizosphaerae]|uniref:Malonyl-CoA synthase n=1 Tax=Salinicola rhizosphaerae TaxID=1443141 RepID=A0ABQ3E348_9GAMM|nr:malonyl-CoA synthase [Salinicola rhizosphaerae]GHB21921.1 malonyl-CoA synthase [Salinicola rhizosphaerae]